MNVYDIAGLGDSHHLTNCRKDPVWREAAGEHKIVFYSLNEAKEVESIPHTAWITSVSTDERYMRLRPEGEDVLSGDLMIDSGAREYGKIVGQEEGLFVLCFTATSDRFPSWISSLLKS